MDFFITYTVTDHEVESNLFWHTAIILSTFDRQAQEMKATHLWGFYSLPKAYKGTDKWLIYILNNYCGLNYDISGTHGVWREEEYRFFDNGVGLNGSTWQVTKEQYDKLIEKCVKVIEEQNAAIEEAANELDLQVKQGGGKIAQYKYEHHSWDIFKHEKKKAALHERASRLKPFEIDLSSDWRGPKMHPESSTCKTVAVELLTGILTDTQIAQITENGKHPAFPRFSGPMEKIYLHSRGPMSTHTNAKGQKKYFRVKGSDGVGLYWTTPPQLCWFLDVSLQSLFSIEPDGNELKLIARKLQSLERLIRNSTYNDIYQDEIKSIVACIEGIFPLCLEYEPEENWVETSILSLFFKPQPRKEPVAMDAFRKKTNELFNTIQKIALEEEEQKMLNKILGTDISACEYSPYAGIF